MSTRAAPAETAAPVVLRLTPEQQEQVRRAAGVRQETVELLPRELAMYALAAAAAGSDVLPICGSPAKRWQLLYPETGGDLGPRPFTVTFALTPEQSEQIARVVARPVRWLRLAPDDFRVKYSEAWPGDDEAPLRVGRTLVVLQAGVPYPAATGDRLITLPTGGTAASRAVFGTGRHPATRLSLELMERYVASGDRVLDVGTGSGILAVAAAGLGAREVLALDVDPAAVAAARETVALNQLGELVQVREGSVEEALGPFDVVVANIYSNVLIALAGRLAAAVRPGGLLVVSGITTAMAERVRDQLRSVGLELRAQQSQDDWTAFAFRSPNSPERTAAA